MTQPLPGLRRAAIMLQGTGSDVGKSLLVAGLARALTRRGMRVAPFKPQNMSNNAAVTSDGGEIGRAQALQARAAGLAANVHMNPVLLKPQTDFGSQIVVQGKVFGNAKARDYYDLKPKLLPRILESFERLQAQADIVLIEGAGSPAEINLRAGDVANMGFAEAADIPVILVADIDRGGVIASVVGTHGLLPPEEQARLKGYLINKFRGDVSLFDDGLRAITERTNIPSLGVLPWFEDAHLLPAEDAMTLDHDAKTAARVKDRPVKIVVPRLARIANFDDLDPLRTEPDVVLEIIPRGRALPGDADLVLLPGSKATLADLEDFRAQGWDVDLHAHLRRGGHVLGLCAGYQMMGTRITDPQGIEGRLRDIKGLGLLETETVLGGSKTLVEVTGVDRSTGAPIHGYEMHIGKTSGLGLDSPMLDLPAGPDGAVTADGRIQGCYVHGLFASDGFRRAFLQRLGATRTANTSYDSVVDATLNKLGDHMEQHCDLDALLRIAEGRIT